MNIRKFLLKLLIVFYFIPLSYIYADDLKLQPLNSLYINASFSILTNQYTNFKLAFVKTNSNGEINDCLLFIYIENNKLWDKTLINIKNKKVESYHLMLTKVSNDFFSHKFPIILKKAYQKYGKKIEFKAIKKDYKDGKFDDPLIIWKKQNRIFTLTYTPKEDVKKNHRSKCYLTVLKDYKDLKKYFTFSQDKNKLRKFKNEFDKLLKDIGE